MKTIPYAESLIDTGTESFNVSYSLTCGEINLPNGVTMAESYGILIEKSDGEQDSVMHITPHYNKIKALLDILIRNQVTPVCFREVLEDLI